MSERGDALQCTDPSLGFLLSAYELGGLSTEDEERFEQHLETCKHCRAELDAMIPILAKIAASQTQLVEQLRAKGIDYDLELSQYRRLEVPSAPAIHKHRRVPEMHSRRARLLWPGFAAAVFVMMFTFTHFIPSVNHHLQSNPTPLTIRPESTVDSAVQRGHDSVAAHNGNAPLLAVVTAKPLPYFSVSARGRNTDEQTELFRQTMLSYQQSDYSGARKALSTYAKRYPQDSRGWLYLGVAEYLMGHYDAAVSHLETARSVSTENIEPANWYLANTLVAVGRVDSSVILLGDISRSSGDYAPDAEKLLREIEAVRSSANR